MTRPGGAQSGPDPRYMVPYEGTVTRRDDPELRGRIKILIPGLIEPETPDWVLPVGGTGGTAHRGHIEPPDVGANVVVVFIQGSLDKIRYFVGPWGRPGGESDAPTNHAVDGDDRANAVTEDEEWRIERDSREDYKSLTITHRTTDLRVVLEAKSGTDRVTIRTAGGQILELDGENGTFSVSADDGGAPEVFGGSGKTKLGDRDATEKCVLGTTYRSDEATFLNALATAIQVFALAASESVTDPILAAAAETLNTTMTTPPIVSSQVRTDGAYVGYLSQNVDVQS